MQYVHNPEKTRRALESSAPRLFSERSDKVEFERPFQVMGGRSHLALMERTTESEDLGGRARKHPTSHIYV